MSREVRAFMEFSIRFYQRDFEFMVSDFMLGFSQTFAGSWALSVPIAGRSGRLLQSRCLHDDDDDGDDDADDESGGNLDSAGHGHADAYYWSHYSFLVLAPSSSFALLELGGVRTFFIQTLSES